MAVTFLTETERKAPLRYQTSGVSFTSPHLDLSGPIRVQIVNVAQAVGNPRVDVSQSINRRRESQVAKATAEFMGWWMQNVHPRLQTTNGYGGLTFVSVV